MTVELISVGTEILLGNIVNTNAAYLAERCALLGLSCYHQSVVGDNEERLEKELRRALSRSDVVILSGGLGPTKDDLTKEVTAKVFGRELREDPHTRERIQEYFDRSGRKLTANNWKQALVPEGATVVDNHNGTAPGLILEGDVEEGKGRTAILLPGPPNEIRPMFERDIAPYLNRREPEGIYSHMIKICGMGESQVEDQVTDLMEQANPTLAPYAKTGEVHLRITARAADEEQAEALIRPVEEELYRRFGNRIFTNREEVTLEEDLVKMLEKRLSDKRIAEWFSDKWRVLNECGIIYLDNITGKTAERRPDRVMTDGNDTIVVDFKFGRKKKEYKNQVSEYMGLLEEMGYKNVKGYIWYVYTNEIENIH